MSSDDYFKYVTESMLKYILSSKEERKAMKQTKKEQKEPFAFRWFGIIPLLVFHQLKKKRKG